MTLSLHKIAIMYQWGFSSVAYDCHFTVTSTADVIPGH